MFEAVPTHIRTRRARVAADRAAILDYAKSCLGEYRLRNIDLNLIELTGGPGFRLIAKTVRAQNLAKTKLWNLKANSGLREILQDVEFDVEVQRIESAAIIGILPTPIVRGNKRSSFNSIDTPDNNSEGDTYPNAKRHRPLNPPDIWDFEDYENNDTNDDEEASENNGDVRALSKSDRVLRSSLNKASTKVIFTEPERGNLKTRGDLPFSLLCNQYSTPVTPQTVSTTPVALTTLALPSTPESATMTPKSTRNLRLELQRRLDAANRNVLISPRATSFPRIVGIDKSADMHSHEEQTARLQTQLAAAQKSVEKKDTEIWNLKKHMEETRQQLHLKQADIAKLKNDVEDQLEEQAVLKRIIGRG